MRKRNALSTGISRANSFLCVFVAIVPAAFIDCLIALVTRIFPELVGKLMAIDGKTLRGSLNADESIVQIVCAWAFHNALAFPHKAVDTKSNEITAVPKLLRE